MDNCDKFQNQTRFLFLLLTDWKYYGCIMAGSRQGGCAVAEVSGLLSGLHARVPC